MQKYFQIFFVTILISQLPQQSNSQLWVQYLDEPTYGYVDCNLGTWEPNNTPYDCWYKCHYNSADNTDIPANQHGMMIWDETYTAEIIQADLPDPVIAAEQLKITMELIKYVPAAGTPLWAGGDNLDVQINGVSIRTEDISTYDTSIVCYDLLNWANTEYTAYQVKFEEVFLMTNLPIFTRNTVTLQVVPNLTNTGTFYGIAGLNIKYTQCDSSCQDCNGNLPTECESCPTGFFLQGNLCQATSCDNTYYGDVNRICRACQVANCYECDSADPTQCTLCETITPYFVQVDGSCATGTCPTGQYNDGVSCVPCDPACVECSGATSSDCTACNDIEYPDDPLGGNCISCPLECDTCTGATQCQTCANGYFLNPNNNICGNAAACPSGTYDDAAQNLCETCHGGCVDCLNSSTVGCQNCQQHPDTMVHYFLNDSNVNSALWVCTSICPDGTWEQTSDHTCVNCNGVCKTCDVNINDCDSCDDDKYLSGTSPNRTCISCHSNCNGCYNSGSTACVECSPGFYKVQGTDECIANCPFGFYGNVVSQQCIVCDDSCDDCTGPFSTGCDRTTCRDKYYDSGTECTLCDFKCDLCDGGLDSECQACSDDPVQLIVYYLDVLDSGTTCLIDCPDGQWGDVTIRECVACVTPCLTCDGGNATDCTGCFSGDYLVGTACVGCDVAADCQTCVDLPTKCTSCNLGKFLLVNDCIPNCPLYYFEDVPNRQCTRCFETCVTCSGLEFDSCTSCESPRFLDGQECKICSDYTGFFADPNDAVTCLPFCGDGIKPNDDHECDDGNTNDGDGCSSICVVEDGFTCIAASASSPDVCYPTDAQFEMNFENNVDIFDNSDFNTNVNIVLTFHQTLVIPNGKTLEDYLIISVDGLDKVDYKLIKDPDNPNIILISLTIPQTLIDREVSVSFSNDTEFITTLTNRSDGKSAAILVIEYYTFYDDSERSYSSTYAKVVQIFMFFQMIFFILLIFTNYFPQVQITLDVLQLLYMFRWCGIKYPLNGHEVFLQLNPVFEWYLPQIYSYLMPEYTNQETYTGYFKSGIDALFWKNADQVLFASSCALGIYLIMKFFTNENLWKLKSKRSRRLQRFFRHYTTIFFEWNFFINVTQSATIPIVFFTALQITNINSQTIVIWSMVVLVIASIWVIGATLFWVALTLKNRKELIYDDPEKDLILRINHKLFKHRIVWEYLNVFNQSAYIQPVFMYFRKVMFPIIIVATHKNISNVQLPILATLNCLYLIYLAIKTPLNNKKKENTKLVLQELMHVLCYIPLFLLADDTNEDTSKRFQWFQLYIIFLLVLLSINVCFLMFIYVIQPITSKIWSQVPNGIERNYNPPNLADQETGKRKNDKISLSGSDNADDDGQMSVDAPQKEEEQHFDISKRKILRQKFQPNSTNFKNSRKQKTMPTTLMTEETRVHARGGK